MHAPDSAVHDVMTDMAAAAVCADAGVRANTVGSTQVVRAGPTYKSLAYKPRAVADAIPHAIRRR